MWLAPFLLLCLRQVRASEHHHNPSADAENDDDEFFFQFVTRPDIGAPKWDIEVYDYESLAPGYWFVAPYANLAQSTFPLWNGPHIYDQRGELIWSGAPMFDHLNIHDFRVSVLNDTDVLTCDFPRELIEGDGVIMDNTYNVQKLVDLVGDNDGPNMHDFNLVDNGAHALMLTTREPEETEINLPWFNGTCRVHWQGFKEVDVETGELIYEWNSFGNIPLDESTYRPRVSGHAKTFAQECEKEWDITHFNAIDKCDDGDYLLSARHTDTIYKISRNGNIVWRLGGLYNDFEFRDSRARFSRQHHVRCRGQNATHTMLTVFDNAIGTGLIEEASSGSSWGLYIAVRTDTQPMTASLIARYEHPSWDRSLLSQSRGSVQPLPNGNTFVGWVFQSLLSEYTGNGRLLMQANLRLRGANSYRNYKFPWVGKPSDPPDVHAVAIQTTADSDALSTVVHVSWNGATEVAVWHLLHTDLYGQFSELIASSPRQGFESKLSFDGFAKHIVVVALDIDGKELGRSNVTETELPPDLKSQSVAHGETQWMEKAKNQSLTWHAPYREPPASFWSSFGWFSLGILFCVLALCVALVLVVRRRGVLRQRWWSSRQGQGQQEYNSVSGSDEDMEQRETEWMLNKEERNEYE